MEGYQERVRDERDELQERHGRLKDFIGSKIYKSLPAEDQTLLIMQFSAMTEYLLILDMRLARFKK